MYSNIFAKRIVLRYTGADSRVGKESTVKYEIKPKHSQTHL